MLKLLFRLVILLIPILFLIVGVTIAIKNEDADKYKITTTNIFVEQKVDLPKTTLIPDAKIGGNLILLDSGAQIDWFTVNSGNTDAASANFGMIGTAAPAAAGFSGSANFGVIQGFWVEAEPGVNCCDVPGDANNDGTVNILDITYLIGYLYLTGPPPPCMYEGDPNANCAVNILDITYLIAYLYQSGPAPICAASCPDW